MNVITLKRQMRVYAVKNGLELPAVNWASDEWGDGAKRLAWRVSGHLHEHGRMKVQTDLPGPLWAYFDPAPHYKIRRDYHAVHSSGSVPLSQKHLIVIHDPEGGSGTTAAETTGSWFENLASGGSTQFGCDNDTIQQYLDMGAVAWGAPYANINGVHVEGYGYAHWTRAEWMKNARGSLDRTAWLIAHIAHQTGIPIRTLTDAQMRSAGKGVTTHAQCTRVYHVAGGHTDPGGGYPLGFVMDLAKKYS